MTTVVSEEGRTVARLRGGYRADSPIARLRVLSHTLPCVDLCPAAVASPEVDGFSTGSNNNNNHNKNNNNHEDYEDEDDDVDITNSTF